MGRLTDEKYRPGAYPHADDAEMFGQLYMAFAEARRQSKQLPPEDRGAFVQEDFENAFYWALPKANNDKEFQRFIQSFYGPDGSMLPMSPGQMALCLSHLKAVLERNFMYGWPKIPEDWPEAQI